MPKTNKLSQSLEELMSFTEIGIGRDVSAYPLFPLRIAKLLSVGMSRAPTHSLNGTENVEDWRK